MNITRDLLDLGLNQKKYTTECITSHKISIVVFIAEYIKLRKPRVYAPKTDDLKQSSDDDASPQYIIDFAIITLHLIQSPDLEFGDLYNLLISGKYSLMPEHIDNFLKHVKDICDEGVNHLMDLNDYFSAKFAKTNLNSDFNVHKLSVVGFFIRRFFLAIKKHSFSDIAHIHENFKRYFDKDREVVSIGTDSSSMDITNNMSNSLGNKLELERQINSVTLGMDHIPCSRKQAELFIATQAALLSANEDVALPPPVLQERIRNLLHNNPGFSEAHFLSYLNCLRVKEFCGALDSLYHSFDRNTGVGENKSIAFDEKADGFRYAALNLAILHVQFGHKTEAMAALKEAIMKAQEANDNVCLQHALTWMYKLNNQNKELLIERSILKSSDLNMNYNMSLGIQSYTQYAGLHGGKPKYVFEIMTKSDVINCQHSIIDLSSNSYAQKAALWQLYGKQELCSLWSQLLLYLKTDHLTRGPTSYNGEGVCQAICNVSNLLTMQGEYEIAYIVLNHARERFPNEPLSHIWMFAENVLCFTQAYHNKLWQKAETAARQMAAINQGESSLFLAEMYLAKCDYDTASLNASVILKQNIQNSDTDYNIVLRIRAMILLAELKCTRFLQCNVSAEVIILLNEALTLAEEYYLQYYVALIHLYMAHVQLWLEMPSHAIELIDKVLGTILAHGSLYDRSRAMLLYVKCLVARANTGNDPNRNGIILSSARLLYEVKDGFEKIQAYSRVKDVLYLQAKLFDYVRSFQERNKCAADFKVFNERYPTATESTTLLTAL